MLSPETVTAVAESVPGNGSANGLTSDEGPRPSHNEAGQAAGLAEVFREIEETAARNAGAGLSAATSYLGRRMIALLGELPVPLDIPWSPEQIGLAWLDGRETEEVEKVTGFRHFGAFITDSSPEVTHMICLAHMDEGAEIFDGGPMEQPEWSRTLLSIEGTSEARILLVATDPERFEPSGPLIEQSSLASRVAHTLFEERTLLLAAAMVGVSQALFRYVLEYTRQRVTFGKAICHHQAVALKLADAATDIETSRLLCLAACEAGEQERTEQAQITCEYVGESLVQTGISLAQLMGGHGFLELHPTPTLLRTLNCLRLLMAQPKAFTEAL